MDRWTQWIYADAPKYGIDPDAAAAISLSTEWPSRAGAGDAGTSYGPFQLHRGGALPSGKGRKWAESRAGVNYALRQMAAHGARGLRGHAAIQAISANFERPADVAREVSQSKAWYNAHKGKGGPVPGVQRLAKTAKAPMAVPQQQNTGALVSYLLGVATNPHDPLSGLPALMASQAQSPQQAPEAPVSVAKARRGTKPTGRVGNIHLADTADRAGVHTAPSVIQFTKRIAGIAGHPLTIGTGTNHSHLTVNGNVSDHWSGHAADIPASGKALIKLGQAALIAAGMNPAKARRMRGGLYNVNGHQIIFNTHEGGDHTNHLHVSAH